MALAHALGKTLSGPGGIGEMSLDELCLWAAWFEDYDPALRDDLRAGTIAQTVANAALGSRGGWKAEDFMPTLKRDSRDAPGAPAWDEHGAEKAMIAWCANAGGEVRTERKKP
jgi:hypothetical protein